MIEIHFIAGLLALLVVDKAANGVGAQNPVLVVLVMLAYWLVRIKRARGISQWLT